MAQRRAKDIEEKEEASRHKKAPQPLYDQRKEAAMPEDGRTGPAGTVLNLQQTYGNRYVQRLVESAKVQARLTVGSPDDEYEREADGVADAISRDPISSVQRQAEPEEEEEEEPEVEVQTKMSRIQRKEEEVDAKPAPEIERSATPVLQRQKDVPGGPEKPPKTTSDPKEIAAKVLEAVSKTAKGKEYTKKLKKAATTKEGIAVISTVAVPLLTAAFAEKMEVPQGLVDFVPEIAKFKRGNIEVSFQPIYKGKFGEKPKEWGAKVNLIIRW